MADGNDMDFFDHLDELRTRLIRCVLYLLPGAVLGWTVKGYVWDLLSVPFYRATEGMQWRVEPEMITLAPEQALFVAMQIALATGLLVALVPILIEIWKFVEPALEPHEKRYAIVFFPGGVLLFVIGMAFAYLVSPFAFRFMFTFASNFELSAKIDISRYIGILVRMLVAFGIVFELPLIMKLLGKLGLVSAGGLLTTWRYAIFIIVVVAAVITPTQDPVNLAILAVPLTALYFFSILLVYLDERAARKHESRTLIADATPPNNDEQEDDSERDKGESASATESEDSNGGEMYPLE